jgi:hypothetical protein
MGSKTHVYAYFQRRQIQTAETYYRETIYSLVIRRRQNRASVAGDGRASEYEPTFRRACITAYCDDVKGFCSIVIRVILSFTPTPHPKKSTDSER